MILNELKRKQINAKLTNQQMADLLEIHVITWVNIKNGKYSLSDSLKQKAIRIYPDLIPLFLSENASKVSNQG